MPETLRGFDPMSVNYHGFTLTRTCTLLGWIATAAVILSPTLMLSMRGGTGYCFFAVLAISLVYLSNADNRRRAAELLRAQRLFAIALLGLPVIVLFQIAVPHTGKFPALDPLLRLALVIPGFLFLSSLPSKQLRLVQWGCVLGALGTGVWAAYAALHPSVWHFAGRLGNSFTNPIPFGDTALLLGFLSVASLTRGARPGWAESAIKVVALIAAGYASYLSGSRGGWIAVPWFLWVGFKGHHWIESRRIRVALGGIVVVSVALLASTSVVRERIAAIGSDVHAMQHGDPDTSTGARLDLWRASVRLYSEHPILGVGRGRLAEGLGELAQRHEIPEAFVNGRAHSEFFSVLAEMGTVGAAALLLLYAGTFRPFWLNRRSSDGDIATASYMGLALVGGTIIFGLTIDVLTLVMNAAFFALTAATLLAWIEARKREIGSSADAN